MLIHRLPDHARETLHPLSTTMALPDAKFGPLTFCELRNYLLASHDCQFTDRTSGADLLHLGADSWLSAAALDSCRQVDGELIMLDPEGHPVAFRTAADAVAADAPSQTLAGSCRIRYPWHLLTVAKLAADDLDLANLPAPGRLHTGTMIDGQLWCGEGTRILPGVYVEGTVIIGKNCKIGPNCYLRGPTFIGDNCRIGQAVEIKASVIMDDSAVGHLSYVGDSVLGNRVNFGAGTITANLRHDGANVRSQIGAELADTDRRKLGTIAGDDVHTGINTAIYPGRKLGAGAATRPAETVDRDRLAPHS